MPAKKKKGHALMASSSDSKGCDSMVITVVLGPIRLGEGGDT